MQPVSAREHAPRFSGCRPLPTDRAVVYLEASRSCGRGVPGCRIRGGRYPIRVIRSDLEHNAVALDEPAKIKDPVRT